MADDSAEHVFRNPNRVSADDPYEVGYFAAVNGLTEDQVRALIKTHGEDVVVLVMAARKLREMRSGPRLDLLSRGATVSQPGWPESRSCLISSGSLSSTSVISSRALPSDLISSSSFA